MRAVQARRLGTGPTGLRIEDVPRPVPGAGEVLIRVHAVGANHLDLGALSGQGPGAAARLPLRVGIDPAGRIVAVGHGVEAERVGTRVVVKPNIPCGTCRWCLAGAEARCPRQEVVGVHRPGGAADLVVVPERNAVPIPAGLPAPVASAAVHAVPIALQMVRRAGEINPGEPVLVTGAAGAVGSALVQILAAAGARPIPVVRSAGHGPVRRGPGADSVGEAVTYDGLAGALTETAPDGVALAFDATGAAGPIAAAWDALGWAGRLVVCAATGDHPLEVDIRRLYLRRLQLIGSASADFGDVTEGLAMVAAGTVQVAVGPEFALEDAVAAYTALSDPHRDGKVLIHVAD
ncbi:alcohol dehydrogenase catalytic domain-containing protein [Phytoactinopolyspora limicola]|uniref:alcohol dehydrogenase catalytic domain-containing protein n=1 Tax=Phytoactinopolyspora limicola TaxID=2715536 RepID=UPI00140C2171|nr:alcohol dehydrogenase catalytic domain-containing protein [Phytoactinopolyspora limicola]